MKFLAVAIFSIIFSSFAQAQTMYRCGSNYQDKPCTSGQTGKVVNILKSATPTAETESKVAIDASCKRRGEDAKRVIWAREGGAQKKDLLAKADSEEQSQLIADVYAVRGNSADVRANIEKDCMAEKELGKHFGLVPDAALLKAVREVQQKLTANEKGESAKKETLSETEAQGAKKRQACPTLKLRLEILNASLRTGVDPQSQQQLNQQKRDLEKEMAANGCHN